MVSVMELFRKSGRNPELLCLVGRRPHRGDIQTEFRGSLRTQQAGKGEVVCSQHKDRQGQSPGGMKDIILEASERLMPLGHADCTWPFFFPTAVLGSGVPLPKILNIDFSNADIDILEVRRERALFCLPRQTQELGGRREGKGRVGQ